MAKIHNGVQIGAGFAYKGTDWNFSRDYYESEADLKAENLSWFPDGFITTVKDSTRYMKYIKSNANWFSIGALDMDEYPSIDIDFNTNLNQNVNIGGDITIYGGIKVIHGGSESYVWNTAGSTTDLTAYAKKTDIPSLSGYVTSSSLNSTLTSYAKLVDANFTSLKLGGNTVATQTWTNNQIASAVSQALKYKGGIAKQTDITTAESSLAVGYVYVCTVAGNYTINGGTTYLEVGDTLICKSITDTAKWTVVQANITGAVTKQTDLVANQLVVGNNASSVKPLAAGSNGTILKMVSGVPTWSTEYRYSLPIATSSVLGGVKSATTDSRNDRTYNVYVDSSGIGYVKVPWTDNNTTYSVFKGATSSAAGTSGLVPSPASGNTSLFLKSDGTWGTPTDTKYTLPVATTSALGGIKLGSTYSGQEPDTSSYFYLQKNGNNVGYIDLSHEKLTDTTYNISVSGASITLTGSDGSTNTVTTNNVANAALASTASKVTNALTIQQLNSAGTAVTSATYNGSAAVAIAAVTYTEIDALFT